ncbi:MAG TPA: RDD family protein [Candidatus Acidoferrales bacterium]|nr:RDD family protein [Candidatus Acidoferrales bacterium]
MNAAGKLVRSERRLMTPEGVPLRIELAEPGERIAAFLADVSLATAGALVVLLAGALASAGMKVTLPIALFVSFLVRNGYFIFFELRWAGTTPGKRLLGLRVIDRRGGPLRAGSVVARNLTRQAEFFFPAEMVLMTRGWVWRPADILPAAIWIAAMAAIYYLSPDRLRAGDLIAGTVVIASPKRVLTEDLARGAQVFEFTREQLQHYGVKELQVLEDVLREGHNAESARLRAEIAERIRKRIGWTQAITGREIEGFLRDFYRAQRAFLESRKNLGEERADKFHAAGVVAPQARKDTN